MKFIDSNVFIYAADSKNPVKRSIARKLITEAVASGGYEINVQTDLLRHEGRESF